jgi:phosphosulfolactate synthase (CoM biosynthesis protein A)
VAFDIANAVGVEHCVFEAADPQVFEWYVKNFGPNVNLFVDNSQIVECECIRSGLWGKKSSWGRVASYRG